MGNTVRKTSQALSPKSNEGIASQEFIEGMMKFTMDLYKLFVNEDDNMFMSPYSVSAALLLASLGAKGATETQIKAALAMDKLTFEQTHGQYKQLQECLCSKTSNLTTLAVANRMFVTLGLNIAPKYISDSKFYYGSEIQLLDFNGHPEGSRQTINTWIQKQTKDKIKDLLPSGKIDGNTLVVLVNAIYFKGNWAKTFDLKQTEMDFHISKDSTMTVDMMRIEAKLRIVRNKKLNLKSIELPYEDGNINGGSPTG